MRADEGSRRGGDGDRLRRRVERTDGLLTWLLCLLVIGGVVVAFLSAVGVRSTVLERSRLESRDRTSVMAMVEQSTVIPGGEGAPARRMAAVRWTGVDGAEHTGRTEVSAAATDGVAAPVWVTADGRVVDAPATAGDATAAAALVAVLVGALVALVTWMFARFLSWWIACRYARCWEADWDRVGPAWTARGHAI